MAGLVPATQGRGLSVSALAPTFRQLRLVSYHPEGDVRDHGGWVYLLASKRNGTLYTGVTNDLIGRVNAHREGTGSTFTRKHGVHRLVWYEFHARIESAIQRETSIKRWPRQWKLNLIEKDNPQWRDLYEALTATPPLPDWAK